MKKNVEVQETEMLSEYDFRKGMRGKHCKAYRKGHIVKIRKENGSRAVQYFKLEDGAIILEPDVRKYFPNSESVNQTLRSLISIMPKMQRKPL